MYEYRALITRVVDGDTVHLDLDLGLHTWLKDWPYRLGRINAPELSTPEGQLAKVGLVDYLGPLPLAVVVRTKRDKADPYKRYIIDIELPGGVNLNDWLVSNGYAVYKAY